MNNDRQKKLPAPIANWHGLVLTSIVLTSIKSKFEIAQT